MDIGVPRSTAPRTDYVQHLYTVDQGSAPPANLLMVGELGIELADPAKLWVGVPTYMDPTGRKLLLNASTAGASITVSSTPPTFKQGALWFDSVSAQLFVGFDDGSSQQWVIAVNVGIETGTGGGGGGIPEAPIDHTSYGRMDAGWTRVIASSGDVFDGGNF